MRYLDLTLPTPEENLALDEALLEEAEAAGRPTETLRFWEPDQPLVVVGRSSRIEAEVHAEACDRSGIPVLRRISGGAAIVAGPGCLMYALLLSVSGRPELRSLDQAHQFVLGTQAGALEMLEPSVWYRGISDLAVGELKFSGNSVRIKRDHLLYHGTLLYDFPLELIGRCLKMPPRQPDYRNSRDHADFLTNLPLRPQDVRRALAAAWETDTQVVAWPRQRTARLVDERYGRREWNEQF